MIKRVPVVKLGVNNRSGYGRSCFGIEVWTRTAKLTNMVIANQEEAKERERDRGQGLAPIKITKSRRGPR